MNLNFKSLIAASAVAAVVCAAGNASAGDSIENGCAAAIGKNIAKYQASVAKNIVGCTKSKAGGKLVDSSIDCTGTTGATPASDLKLKIPGARQKVIDGINGKCVSGIANVLANYPTCPSPSSITYPTAGGSTITNATDLAKCLIGLSDSYVQRMAQQVIGNVTNAVTGQSFATTFGAIPGDALSDCQNGIGKAFSKAVKTYGGVYTKSQAAYSKLVLTTGSNLTYGVRTTGDPDSKASLAISAVGTAVTASCGAVAAGNPVTPNAGAWPTLHTCGQSTTDQASCAQSVLTRQLSGLTGAIFEFPHTGSALRCASFADIVINAGNESKMTNSRLDSGFTGAGHKVDIIDQSTGGVALTGCDDNCANCDIGIDPTNGYCRCENNPKVECDAVPTAGGEQTDADDCGGTLCHCMFGPPLPLSSAGTPVCVVNRFARSFTGGTTAVGSYDVGTRTKSLVFLGTSALRPCPTCEGDGTPRDGIKGGLCRYADEDPIGGNPGDPCDIDASLTLGGIPNNVSFDCFPITASAGTLNLGLQFTDGTKSLTAAVGGANCAAGTCHCSECTADPTVGCATTADCTAAGLGGTCGVNLGGNNPRQNSCTAGIADCTADSNNPGMGACNQIDKFCDGAVRPDGSGIIPCSNDASCNAYTSICDGGVCGSCVQGLPKSARSCFLPTISATGTSGVFDSEGVSVFCSAATSNGTVNSAAGLPGPGRVKLDFDFDILCSDHATTYQLPGGMNCP